MNNVDISLIVERKLDSSFPDAQFFIEGYNKSLRLDVSTKSHLPTRRQLTKVKNSNGYTNYNL